MKTVKLMVVSLVCLAALWFVVPGLLMAQEELSLDVLAEQVQTLTERMDALESLWIESEPSVRSTGECIVGSEGGMHDSTVMKYRNEFEEWPDVDYIKIKGVSYNPDTGDIAIQYEESIGDDFIIELWRDCEFLESTDWWDGSYRDEPFQIPPLQNS